MCNDICIMCYFSEAVVTKGEADEGPTVFVAIEKSGHHRSVRELLNNNERMLTMPVFV